MSFSAAERETVIQMDDESDLVRIWSAQRAQITRMRKNSSFTCVRSGNNGGSEWAEFTIPKSEWNVTGVKRKRTLTDEQREALAERLRKGREAK